MTESLFIACMAIVVCIAVLLIIWLIFAAVRKATHGGKTITVDGAEYMLVPVGENPEKYRRREQRRNAAAETGHVSQITESPVYPANARGEALPAAENASSEVAATVEESTRQEETAAPAESAASPLTREGEITLRRSAAVPYEEAYAALSPEEKGYVDDILSHAMTKDGAKQVVNEHAACVYFGKKQLVRILLRRGRITARMQVQNNALASYADDNNFNLREKPVDVRVESAETAGYVKGVIDINYSAFKDEREKKEARQKEERRVKRMQKRGQTPQGNG